MRSHALAAALLLAGCASAPKELPPLAPPASQSELQADYAARLFMESCVAHITKPGDLGQWIQERGLRRIEPEIEAKVLAGEQGEVWSATSPVGGFLVIVVPINESLNRCSVWAQRANAERLNQHFERLLRGAERPGIALEQVSDEQIQGPGGSYRQLVYYLRKEAAEFGWVFVSDTSASEQVEIQGRLLVAPGKGRQVFAPGSSVTPDPSDSP
jgi:hypothetical protein